MDPARAGAAARPFMSSRGAHAHPQVRTARRGEKLMRLKNAARGRAVGREGRPGCLALAPDTASTAAALADGRQGHRAPHMRRTCAREAPSEGQRRVSKGGWEWFSGARGGCAPSEDAGRWRPVDLRWWVSRRGNKEGGNSKMAPLSCPQNGQDQRGHKRPYSESMDQGRGASRMWRV